MTIERGKVYDSIDRPEGFDRYDAATWPTYDELTHKEAVLAMADEMGEDGMARYEGTGFDWERFTEKLEAYLCINLPTTWEDPIYSAIKAKARKAWRESNG
jgi:hypothetical protein